MQDCAGVILCAAERATQVALQVNGSLLCLYLRHLGVIFIVCSLHINLDIVTLGSLYNVNTNLWSNTSWKCFGQEQPFSNVVTEATPVNDQNRINLSDPPIGHQFPQSHNNVKKYDLESWHEEVKWLGYHTPNQK